MGKKKQQKQYDKWVDEMVREARMTPEEREAKEREQAEKTRKALDKARRREEEVGIAIHLSTVKPLQASKAFTAARIAELGLEGDELADRLIAVYDRLIAQVPGHVWEEQRCSICLVTRVETVAED